MEVFSGRQCSIKLVLLLILLTLCVINPALAAADSQPDKSNAGNEVAIKHSNDLGVPAVTTPPLATPAESAGPSAPVNLPPKLYSKPLESEGYAPFAFAISGGISLGSYEAGVNWALVEYHKLLSDMPRHPNFLPPKLMAVTGASAGGINALMTGISWCIDQKKVKGTEFADSVEKNLFKDIWLAVGFDSLLPERPDYWKDDGVLTRKAFKDVLDRLNREMDAPVFLDGCSVPIGLMVTRTTPVSIPVNGVTVTNERFIIPLLLTVEKGAARFKPDLVNSEVTGLGNVIYLPGSGQRDSSGIPYIANSQVIDAVLASSAFPVAFGRKELNYCRQKRYSTEEGSFPDKDHLCPGGYLYDSTDFVDGGVFDNIPLGAAKALAEPHEFDIRTHDAWSKAGRRYNYIYIDPDHRRGPQAKKEEGLAPETRRDEKKEEKTYGLRSQLGFLSGAITTGRSYELYKTMSNGDWSRQAPLFTLKEVIPAIDRAVRSNRGSIMGERKDAPPAVECDSLYATLAMNPERRPSLNELLVGRRCLRAEAVSLGNSYLFSSPGGEALRTDQEVSALRSRLLEHDHLLVRHLNKQVDLFVQKMTRDKLGDRKVILSSRFFPITGNYLAYFGAFIDRPLREFDYYAGVYDAVNNLAEHACEGPTSLKEMQEGEVFWTPAQKERCAVDKAAIIYRNLGIHDDSKADTVFHFLSAREKREFADWDWLSQYPVGKEDSNLLAIGRSLEKTETAADVNDASGKKKESEFKIFITNLATSGYDTSGSCNDMKRILELHEKDESTWYYALSSRASERLLQLEGREAEVKDGGGGLKTGLSLGALALNTVIHEDRRLMLSPSSAPAHTWQNILPYEIFFDVNNGGVAVAWEPRLRLVKQLYLGLKATPFGYNQYGEDWIPFSQGDLYLTYNQENNIFSAGIGPTINATWDRWPGHKQVNLGGAFFVGFYNKIRVTFGRRSFDKGGFGGDNLYVDLGITDIPGIVYWLTR